MDHFTSADQHKIYQHLHGIDWHEILQDSNPARGESRAHFFTICDRSGNHEQFRHKFLISLDYQMNQTAAILCKSENVHTEPKDDLPGHDWPHLHGILIAPGNLQSDHLKAVLAAYLIQAARRAGQPLSAAQACALCHCSAIYPATPKNPKPLELFAYLAKETDPIPGFSARYWRTVRWSNAPVPAIQCK